MKYDLKDLLMLASEKGASDVHFTVGSPPMVRVDGELIPLIEDKLFEEDMEELANPVLDARRKGILEDEGEVDFAYSLKSVGRFRTNVFHQRGSLAMSIRLLPFHIPKAESLGVPKPVIDMIQRKRGLVLVTGPTGSGKSTTLASMIDILNETLASHIITLEDPIEYLHKHKKALVNQREIGLDSKSYANALRAALRQDPDVILVGEMRDLDTISTAITAAETGHLVFSTLHTIGAANTIDRVIDVFPPHQQQQIRIQLSTVLECVISQQLLPKKGSGRVAAFEVMFGNAAIRNLIREGKTFQIPSVMQTSRKSGMILMDDALIDLYERDLIDGATAVRFAQSPMALSKKIIL